MSVRVRFAPSPTGALHIGGVRTALYNYLFARKHGGKFLLRIEDTDQNRFVPGAEDYIIESLKWVGLIPDEGVGFGGDRGPYRQSDRKAIYLEHAQTLVKRGHAYYAFDTPEVLEAQRAKDDNFTYNHHTRGSLDNSLTLPAEETAQRLASGAPYVIRLKVLPGHDVRIFDLIRGEVTFQSSLLDDKVLLKADGMPTYHLANIIDDHLMQITHVIRGEEWLPSTAHHVLLYQGFGWEDTMPKFSHLPLILKPVGDGKLSKRDGAKFGMPVFPLEWKGETPEDDFPGFRETGFLPGAVVNFLALLGWHPGGEQEIFSLDELVQVFSVDHISKGGARFDYEKAKWFNQKYIQNSDPADLVVYVRPLAVAEGYTVTDEYLQQAIVLMKERVTFLPDFVKQGYYLFEPVRAYDLETVQKKWTPAVAAVFGELTDAIAATTTTDAHELEASVKQFMTEKGLKPGDIMPLLRIALAGTMKGPGVFDMVLVLGRAETTARLKRFVAEATGGGAVAEEPSQPIEKTPVVALSPSEQIEINKHPIDNRMRRIIADNPEWFKRTKDEQQKKSLAFVVLGVAHYLDIDLEEAQSLVTDGGNDAGIDAIHIGDVNESEFVVTLFQSKYSFDLSKNSNFPANAIQKLISAIGVIFDLDKALQANENLTAKVAEIRAFIKEGYIPNVRCVCMNNGLKWPQEGDLHISNASFEKDKVQFEYFNHNDIAKGLMRAKPVNDYIQFSGERIKEDYNFKRVFLGKVNVTQIAQLLNTHGDALLERNIRRYLGLPNKHVNKSIQDTLTGSDKDNFYLFNNGITIVCKKFDFNALQPLNNKVLVEDIQIINGGQTCKTIQQTLKDFPSDDAYSNVFVLVRLYELSGKQEEVEKLISDVTIATNSQTPVDLRDLRSNDENQRRLKADIDALGYVYKTKRDVNVSGDSIPSTVVAESVFTVWREKPHVAKFKRLELFGQFYNVIFNNLNAAQAVLAVLIYRYCDNRRRDSEFFVEKPHLPYSNYFLSMIIGKIILADFKTVLTGLTHRNFTAIKDYFEQNKEKLYDQATEILEKALNDFYPNGYKTVEARKLSATFRRSDLIGYLPEF